MTSMTEPPEIMPASSLCAHTSRSRGFTLVELMVVVSIIAVLATVAGVAFGKYAKKVKTEAARAMLLAIAGAETNEDPYVGSGATATYCPPATELGSGIMDWPTSCESAVWLTLGIPRPNQTRYSYAIAAGSAADICGMGSPFCDSVTAGEKWWVAVAMGDLDGDGVRSTFITSYAMNGAIYTSNEFE